VRDGPEQRYYLLVFASGEVLVLDVAVPSGLYDGSGAAVGPSLALPGDVIGAVEDVSGLVMPGAAGVVSAPVPTGLPPGTPGCVAWPVAGEFGSAVVVVWACAATDATRAPAAKNGTSLLLMVMMHLLCERYRRGRAAEVP
jgi:hypothetical protein